MGSGGCQSVPDVEINNLLVNLPKLMNNHLKGILSINEGWCALSLAKTAINPYSLFFVKR
jgi:hypothetical protein